MGDAIKGSPPNPAAELVGVIRQAVRQKSRNAVTVRTAKPTRTGIPKGEIYCESIRSEDIVLSGSDHRDLLVQILRQARSVFVMHTTFLRADAFVLLQEEFRRAAKRGVAIDIFWGADGG